MKKNWFILVSLILVTTVTWSQMRIVPVKRYESRQTPNQKIEEVVLNLPFWDDFSQSDNEPSPDLWEPTNGVWVNNGAGINPPTIMMATFDGLDSSGKPYSLETNEDGITDVLTSHPIDLSTLFVSDQVFISFFIQARGNGEIPNEEDSIQLRGKYSDGTFVRMWGVAGKNITPDTFNIVTIQLDQQEFFHDNFQLQFRSYGRQSGPFDAWHLDYVYMNKGVSDFNFPDRALQNGPGTPFKNYTAIPITHFNESPTNLLDYSVSSAYNLHDKLQPANFTIFAEIKNLQPDLSWQISKDTLALEIPSSFPDPIITETRQIDLVADRLLNPAKVQSDTLTEINLTLLMNTDDNSGVDYDPAVYAPLDFRVNDTISSQYILHDYYAYDDGTAEYAAGLNYDGNKIAYRFEMGKSGYDTLVAVEMYFPNFSTESSKLIDLMIWNAKGGIPNLTLHRETIPIQSAEQINQFNRYYLQKPIVVKDTFFIGWEHTINGNLDIGLDKNNNTGDRMFFHLGSDWQLNFSVEGSLMLHPVFGRGDIIVGIEKPIETLMNIYPNPARNVVNFSKPVEKIWVLDIQGKKVAEKSYLEPVKSLDISNLKRGLYFLRIIVGGQVISHKLLIEN